MKKVKSNQSVQKYIQKLITIAINSRISREELEKIQLKEQIKKIKYRFALGFQKRIEDRVP